MKRAAFMWGLVSVGFAAVYGMLSTNCSPLPVRACAPCPAAFSCNWQNGQCEADDAPREPEPGQ